VEWPRGRTVLPSRLEIELPAPRRPAAAGPSRLNRPPQCETQYDQSWRTSRLLLQDLGDEPLELLQRFAGPADLLALSAAPARFPSCSFHLLDFPVPFLHVALGRR